MLKGLARNSRITRLFASKPPAKVDPVDADLAKKPKQSQAISTPAADKSFVKVDPKKFTLATGNLYEFLQNGYKIDELTETEYKKYPSHISHFNPSSPDYIPSEYIEKTAHNEVNDYNKIIDNLKLDLKLMREYQEGVQKLIEKSKDKLVRGNTRSVYDETKDYGNGADGLKDPDAWAFQQTLDLLDNLKITINNTAYHRKLPKLSNIVAWEKELAERPVTKFFNHAKGHKYDVEVPYEERAPHVADRLGHPEVFPTPFETLLRLERQHAHPGYLDQPFIQTPKAEPDASLNFKAGEVIYENPKSSEWNRLHLLNFAAGTVLLAVWQPFATIMKSSTPFPKVREEVFTPFYDLNFYNFDTYQLWVPVYLFAATTFLSSGLVSSPATDQRHYQAVRHQGAVQPDQGSHFRDKDQSLRRSRKLSRLKKCTKSLTWNGCRQTQSPSPSTWTFQKTASQQSLT